jgi:hypothetical protein
MNDGMPPEARKIHANFGFGIGYMLDIDVWTIHIEFVGHSGEMKGGVLKFDIDDSHQRRA